MKLFLKNIVNTNFFAKKLAANLAGIFCVNLFLKT